MELVEEDNAHLRQLGIVLQPAQQNAFGHITDARAEAGLVIEPNLVAYLPAKLHAAFPRHPRRHRPRRHPPRLQHHDLLISGQPRIQQHLRNLGSFARTSWRDQHEPVVGAQSLNDLRMDLPDGKRLFSQ